MSSQEKPVQSSEKLTFEAALEKLQVSVKKLESGELSLEEALKQFEEGIQLTRICQEYLTAAEHKIEILTQGGSGDSPQLKNFGE
jgi:exodeoxyribonuclease VII small subunit